VLRSSIKICYEIWKQGLAYFLDPGIRILHNILGDQGYDKDFRFGILIRATWNFLESGIRIEQKFWIRDQIFGKTTRSQMKKLPMSRSCNEVNFKTPRVAVSVPSTFFSWDFTIVIVVKNETFTNLEFCKLNVLQKLKHRDFLKL